MDEVKIKHFIKNMKLEGFRRKGKLIIKLNRKKMDIKQIPWHFTIDLELDKIKKYEEKK